MRACAMQLGDDIRDCVADAWNFRKPLFGDDLVQGPAQRAQTVGRAGIGLGPVRIAAAQGRARGEFSEQLGDGGGVEGSHAGNNAQRRNFAPSAASVRLTAVQT